MCIRTSDLIQAAKELSRDHSNKYARSCIRAVRRENMISCFQYCRAMTILFLKN